MTLPFRVSVTVRLQLPEAFTRTTRPFTLQVSPADFFIFILDPFGAFGKVSFVANPDKLGILLVLAKYRIALESLLIDLATEAVKTSVDLWTETSTGLLLTAQTLPPPEPL